MRNLIFISHRIPFPPDKGEKIRAYNLIRHLAKEYQVYLGCLVEDAADMLHVPYLRTICKDVGAFQIDRRMQKLKALTHLRPGNPLMLEYYSHPGLQNWVSVTTATVPMDVVYIFCTAMAPYGLHLTCTARILDMQDIDSEKWALYADNSRWPASAVWHREARTLLRFERYAASHCDMTFLVTEAETRRFAELAPEVSDRLAPIQMGVDLDRLSSEINFDDPYDGDGPHLVFVGNMDYWPNVDAVIWFATDVLPLVRHHMPQAQFHIVGANPTTDVRRLAKQQGVHVTGRVADVRPYVAHADVSVAPLRMARGVQNKVLEAMALSRPVVASSPAFAGVLATPGHDLLVVDGAEATAKAIIEVVEGHYPDLGVNGRAFIERNHTWHAILAQLDACLEQVLNPASVDGVIT